MTLEEQIAAIEEAAFDYAECIADPKFGDEQMRDYWLFTAQGWMMVLGLRRAQLVSWQPYLGMVLVA